ncbi:hypothetical protein [Rugosimonospora africana]|uniref:DUF1440 domain-containing protein n=1 Tax=Rugosimonospora africana TaxID=556532 RepID=A0A8J3QLR2_9ACTN|nr:hypothetical protein [Rugosimonospora africana]GIH12916.1 hypothetical protein Raf01_10880 [Rugosimonospora africana]
MIRQVLLGAAAGAAGTTVLNAVTYADMTLRGRAASTTPERTVDQVVGRAHTHIPGDEEHRGNRRSALGALSGIATGIAVGAAYGMARAAGFRPPLWAGALAVGGAAMLSADVPLAALKVSDPRTWSRTDWLADAIPHLAYGAVTAATAEAVCDR